MKCMLMISAMLLSALCCRAYNNEFKLAEAKVSSGKLLECNNFPTKLVSERMCMFRCLMVILITKNITSCICTIVRCCLTPAKRGIIGSGELTRQFRHSSVLER